MVQVDLLLRTAAIDEHVVAGGVWRECSVYVFVWSETVKDGVIKLECTPPSACTAEVARCRI